MTECTAVAIALAMLVVGCGSSDPSECEQACDRIEQACLGRESDCVDDCSEDLDECPDEMQAVLDCVLASELRCDPEQDQGLAEAPCQDEHDATELCGADPF